MQRLKGLCLPAALLLASCATQPDYQVYQSYPSQRLTSPPLVGTEIAGPGTILQPLPTGVLLLTKAVDGGAFDRNMATCRAFFRDLPSTAEIRDASPVAPNVIATRWLNEGPTVASNDCAYLVSHYDYGRAERLIQRVRMQGKRGPFFAGFLGNSYVVVDGSSYANDNIHQFVSKWAQAILRANREYARLAVDSDPILIPASTSAQPDLANVPGPALILFGILKTAVDLIFAVASVFTGS